MKQQKILGFTLVELIIVITIIAILAIIAFFSFQEHLWSSRDANRLATIKNIDTGIGLYSLKTWKVPLPDEITGTGVINDIPLHFVGSIGKNISSIIQIQWKVTDPKNNPYLYGVSFDKKYYQIATLLENWDYAWSITPQTYALEGDTWYVVGNYDGLIIFNSWAYLKYIANLPSLIFSKTGSIDIISSEANFLYRGKKLGVSKNTLLQEITGKNISLTGILLTNNQNQVKDLSNKLWYDTKKIWEKIFGKKYIETIISDKLAIYYGYPSSLNYEKNNYHLDMIVADLNEYDTIIIGDGLEESTHSDYQNTKDILHGTGANLWYAPSGYSGYTWVSYGYITLMKDISSIQSAIDKWKALGVDGIFFDEAWYDFLIDNYTFTSKTDVRNHQNTAINYAQSQGLKVIMNSWNIDDVFGTSFWEATTSLSSWDGYLMESFVYNPHATETDYYEYDALESWEKVQKATNYKNNFWVKIYCVWLLPNHSDITPERIDTFYEKSAGFCDSIQITQESFWAAAPHTLINYLKEYK